MQNSSVKVFKIENPEFKILESQINEFKIF